jgi:hypothetical protein
MDGTSFSSATKLVITALGTEQNTGMAWYTYPSTSAAFPPAENANVTVKNQWGSAPSLVEGIPAMIVLPYAYDKVKVWSLSNTGARVAELAAVTNSNGKAGFAISPASNTLWYEVQAAAGSFITEISQRREIRQQQPVITISEHSGRIVLTISGENTGSVQVFDSKGRVCAVLVLAGKGMSTIDTRTWANGIYMVRAKVNNQTIIDKIFVR